MFNYLKKNERMNYMSLMHDISNKNKFRNQLSYTNKEIKVTKFEDIFSKLLICSCLTYF